MPFLAQPRFLSRLLVVRAEHPLGADVIDAGLLEPDRGADAAQEEIALRVLEDRLHRLASISEKSPASRGMGMNEKASNSR